MKATMCNGLAIAMGTAILLMTVTAAPVESDDEQSENSLVARPGSVSNDLEYSPSWDAVDAAALRKLLLQLDADDRMGRVSRGWPQAEPRGWGRSLEGRLVRPWRADKRQVRFRQCYFNPISCFRK